MSSVIITGDTSGAITLAAPTVAGTNTITLPANTGTAITTASTAVITQAMLSTGVSGNGPAFSAYQNTGQTGVVNFTPTKVTLDTEIFDTNNNFASSRFTPTVAGYYQFNYSISIPYASTTAYIFSILYKNGNASSGFANSVSGNGSTYPQSAGSCLLYMNGSTDYVELFAYGAPNTGSTFNINTGINSTGFSGFLARAA